MSPRPAVPDLAARRDRRAWLAAARHLEARGLPPCVPCSLVPWLHRCGVRSAWCQERAT
jgi:hypothetical protein